MKSINNITVIAELANAHEGDVETAAEIIDAVSDSADAVKIHAFTADDLAFKTHSDYDRYQRLSVSTEEISSLVEVAHGSGMYLFADILGENGLSRAKETDIDGFKIHSSSVSHSTLIEEAARTNRATLLYVGGATSLEIREAIATFDGISEADVGLIYGFQNYPTKLGNAHLNRLKKIIEEFGSEYEIGYTSHVDGGTDVAMHLPSWAIAAGADFVEVHTTLDRSIEGTDYYSSLEPDRFHTMQQNIAKTQIALGDDTVTMSDKELEYRDEHKKCVMATRRLAPGDVISAEDVELKRPSVDVEYTFEQPDQVIGKTVAQLIDSQTPVRTTDLQYRVVATLACRAESTRLYGKPLQRLGDRAILAHQISQIEDVNAIDETVLAIADTPSKSIFVNFAKEKGIPYVIGDNVDVLGRLIKAGESEDADFVVRSTTENPFIYRKGIKNLINISTENNGDLVVYRNLPVGSSASVVSVSALSRAHKFGKDKHKSEFATSFILDNPQSFTIISVEPPKGLNRPEVRLTADNPADLILMRKLWKHVSKLEDPYDLESILYHYDEHDLDRINEDYADGTDDEVIEVAWHKYGAPDDRTESTDQ